MSEADWWLCSGCSSLNNLSARKCYSCGQRKPKDARRATEVLNYVPVVSWDGKVTIVNRPIEAPPRAMDAEGEPQARPAAPPPLREPRPRDTLAVAPRPPHPATITYRPEPQAHPMPAPPGSPGYPSASPSFPPGASRNPLASPVGPVPPPAPPGYPPALRGPVGPPAVRVPGPPRPPMPPSPVVAVGPGPGPYGVPQSGAAQWPHWRELLDGPKPHAERLRPSPSGESDSLLAKRVGVAASRDRSSLQRALQEAQEGDAPSRPFVPWPAADLRRQPDEPDPGDEEPLPPAPGPGS